MSYSTPPSYIRNAVNHIVGSATVLQLAAPGVGFCYRLVEIDTSITRTSTGIVDHNLITTASGTFIWGPGGRSLNGQAGAQIIFPEPGIQLPENEGLNFVATSTVAAGASVCYVYYFIDDIS